MNSDAYRSSLLSGDKEIRRAGKFLARPSMNCDPRFDVLLINLVRNLQ